MRRRQIAALALGAFVSGACASSLERGEERYQQGDRQGALALWRSIPDDSHQAPVARQRIAAVEDEQQTLVARYRQRGLYFERKERLAEAILSWRVVSKLDPSDAETVAHVQDLSRRLATGKVALDAQWRADLAAGRLAEAREKVGTLRALDPFDPAIEAGQREVSAALDERVEGLLAEGRRGFAAGEYETATLRFREVLTLEPEQESARGYLAYIDQVRESERTRPAPAPAPAPDRTASRRARALRTSDPQIRAEGFHQNALAAARAGDPYAAIGHELRALDVEPDHAAARKHLAELRAELRADVPGLIDAGRTAFQQEDLEAALEQWRRALLVEPDNDRAAQYAERARKLLQNLEQLRSEPDPSRAVGARP